MGDTLLGEKGSEPMESLEEGKRKCKEKESRFGRWGNNELRRDKKVSEETKVAVQKASKDGLLTGEDLDKVLDKAELRRLEADMVHLNLRQALQVWNTATVEERRLILEPLLKK